MTLSQPSKLDAGTTPGLPCNVADLLLAGKDPAKPALLLPDGDRNYGELRTWTNAFAAFLLHNGAPPGQRVIIAGENSLFWVAAYLGAMRAGLVAVPLPTDIPASELRQVIRSTDARFAFLQNSFAIAHELDFADAIITTDRVAEDKPRSHPTGEEVYRQYRATTIPPARVSGDDLATLMFTSGSTGTPRGVMISHRNIAANTQSIIASLQLTERDRVMAVLPFHYCYGASLLHTHLRVGGSLVIDHRFMFPEIVLRRMRETNCTGFAGVPSHYQILLRRSGLRSMDFPSLRYVQQAGGHLAPQLVRELRQALPRTDIYLMYGQTEATARLSYLPPEYLERKPSSIGRGIPGVRLTVVNEQGNAVNPGEVGEIVAEGENIALGYWGDCPDDELCFRNGRLHTGDLATVDGDGFIYIVDRLKDFVKCGSKRVSCRSVEDRLLECDELVEAAVVGIPDEVLGEAVQAFVVPREYAAQGIEERVQAYCKEHLPYHLVPRKIVLVQNLPKNSAGKVLKSNLKKAAVQGVFAPGLQSPLTGASYADRCAPDGGRNEMAGA